LRDPLSSPSGVRGPVLGPPCMRQRSFAIAAPRHLASRHTEARHQRAPSARGECAHENRLDLARDDSLPAFGPCDVLDDDALRAARAKPLHVRHPGLIRSRHPGDRAGKPRALDIRPSRRSGCCWRSMRSMQRLSWAESLIVDEGIAAIWCALLAA
jgi:hypothetical protein